MMKKRISKTSIMIFMICISSIASFSTFPVNAITTYVPQTIANGHYINYRSISNGLGDGYHVDTIGSRDYNYNFLAYTNEIITDTEFVVSGYFRQDDTFSTSLQPNRRFLKAYILDANNPSTIVKTITILDYTDGTEFVHKEFKVSGLSPGEYFLGFGRGDSWSTDWKLVAEWVGVEISALSQPIIIHGKLVDKDNRPLQYEKLSLKLGTLVLDQCNTDLDGNYILSTDILDSSTTLYIEADKICDIYEAVSVAPGGNYNKNIESLGYYYDDYGYTMKWPRFWEGITECNVDFVLSTSHHLSVNAETGIPTTTGSVFCESYIEVDHGVEFYEDILGVHYQQSSTWTQVKDVITYYKFSKMSTVYPATWIKKQDDTESNAAGTSTENKQLITLAADTSNILAGLVPGGFAFQGPFALFSMVTKAAASQGRVYYEYDYSDDKRMVTMTTKPNSPTIGYPNAIPYAYDERETSSTHPFQDDRWSLSISNYLELELPNEDPSGWYSIEITHRLWLTRYNRIIRFPAILTNYYFDYPVEVLMFYIP